MRLTEPYPAVEPLAPQWLRSMKGISEMSRTFSGPRWGQSAYYAGVLALLLSALAAVCLTTRADAAFTTGGMRRVRHRRPRRLVCP